MAPDADPFDRFLTASFDDYTVLLDNYTTRRRTYRGY